MADVRETEKFLTISEAASLLRVGKQAIYRYIGDGRLPAYRLRGGRGVRIRREDVLAMLVPVEPRNARNSR